VALRQLDRGQGKDLHSPGAHEVKSLYTFREESMHDRTYVIGYRNSTALNSYEAVLVKIEHRVLPCTSDMRTAPCEVRIKAPTILTR
jgi:hypothetical protein